MSNRLVRRYFKCSKCKEIESQLINPHQFQTKCSNCNSYLSEIQEKEFKILKSNKKQSNEHKSTNFNSPYMPRENAFKNISSVYERPPSRTTNQRQNDIRENRFNNNNNRQEPNVRSRRNQSSAHYSDMNFNYFNNNNDNNYNVYNNINIDRNIFNNNNINQNNNRYNYESGNDNIINEHIERERRRDYGGGARHRDHSSDPMNSSFFNNFFNNIFGFQGINPMSPIIISSQERGPFRVFVQRQSVPQYIFDPLFLSFGAMFDNSFRDNFSSNFRSNFRGNFLNEIIRILERNQEEAARNKHPPTTEEALKKLKRFPLTEKYCKKDKKGKLELPNCCICLSDIEKNEETVLLPCGHMFHWNCCLNWLKGNNTCPMCRFVIKD